MNNILQLACFILITACATKKEKTLPLPIVVIKQDTIMDSRWYLSNRISDCDKAIAFMDSVIVKERIFINEEIIASQVRITSPVIEGGLGIRNDTSTKIYKTKKYLYYIDKECFIEKPSAVLFSVFCPKSQISLMQKLDTQHTQNNKKWHLVLSGINGFYINAYFEKGRVKTIEIGEMGTITNQ